MTKFFSLLTSFTVLFAFQVTQANELPSAFNNLVKSIHKLPSLPHEFPELKISTNQQFGESLALSGNHLLVGDLYANEGVFSGTAYMVELNVAAETDVLQWSLF